MGHAIVNIMKPNDFFEEVELQLSEDIIGNVFEGDLSNTRFFKPKMGGMVCNTMCFNLSENYPLNALYVSTNLITSEDSVDPGFNVQEMPYFSTPLRILADDRQEFTHIVFTNNTYICIRAYDGAVIPDNLEAWLLIDTNISYYHK